MTVRRIEKKGRGEDEPIAENREKRRVQYVKGLTCASSLSQSHPSAVSSVITFILSEAQTIQNFKPKFPYYSF